VLQQHAAGADHQHALPDYLVTMTLAEDEKWLLELVVEARAPLSLLANPELELAINRLAPRRAAHAWRALVDGLRGRALIELTDEGGETYFALTRDGGAAWEAFARPDWSRFIDARADGTDAEVICADRARLDAFVASRWQAWIPAGAERRDELRPWAATYWKTLPVGYRVRYVYREREPADLTTDEYAQRNAWLDDVNRWYERVALTR
jgi:hypothetical protein